MAVDKVGNIYVSVTVSEDPGYTFGSIWKFPSTLAGEKSELVRITGATFAGLAVDAIGNVYAATNGPEKGVIVVDRDGGYVFLPGTEDIESPNSLAFDNRGNLYITDFFSLDSEGCAGYGQGGIYRFAKGAASAELWLRDELLTGYCPGGFLGYPGGANGIQFYQGDLYVVNSDKHTIVRIPVEPDGSAGEPTIWAEIKAVSDSPWAGYFPTMGDGLVFDVHGNAYVAVVTHSAIVRIDADYPHQQETIAMWPYVALDTPASLVFGTGKGGRQSIFITSIGAIKLFGLPSPGSALTKIDVDIPGMPLP